MVEVEAYYRERKEFFSKYPNFFSDLPELEYALYGSLVFNEEVANEIKYASEELWKVLRRVKEEVIALTPMELETLGYPKELIPYLYLDYLSFDTVLSRFDFIVKDGLIKAIEINNVTPFLVSETFVMNDEVLKNENSKIKISNNENSKNKNFIFEKSKNEISKSQKLFSTNENSKNEITSSYVRGIIDCCHFLKIKKPKIGIVSQDLWEDWEEYEQVSTIRNAIPDYVGDIEFFNIKELEIIFDEGVYAPSGDKIDVLILPAYPYEFLINDKDEEGNNIGIELLKLVESRKLAVLNPPSANVLQSKISFAVLWNMYENGELTPHEEEIVFRYLTPTYDTPMPFIESGKPYVKKATIGREGSSVEIIRGNEVTKSKYDLYNDFQSVYQEFIELPKLNVIINNEYQEKSYIIGSFICNDKAVGLSCRLGGEITEWDSHWLAVSYIK